MPKKESDDLPSPVHVEKPKNKISKKSKKKSDENKKESNSEMEEKILENLVALQKVHTNLAEKFDSLSGQISNLLELFEGAAKNFGENPANHVTEKDSEFLKKIDRLLDQNKTIAKGLTMMDERIREKPVQHHKAPNLPEEEGPEKVGITSTTRPLPRF